MDRYDKSYFDKWYRDPAHRVSTPAMTRRKAALAVAMAEYYLQRPVRTVLDVGCGEGQWQPVLARLRPGIRYTGVDPSAYAVRRYGARRNLLCGSFGGLGTLPLAAFYDLIVCSNVLYYVPADELERGVCAIAERLGGVAFLEAYASEEGLTGDTSTMEPRDVAFYQRLFRKAGLVSCGSHCYVGEALADCVTALERGGINGRPRAAS
jgi:SAM-dependent methyltransferase